MTALDTTLRQKVYDTIQDLGKTLTFHSNAGSSGSGTYNPATGLFEGTPVAVTYDVKCSPPSPYVSRIADTDAVLTGAVETTMPALNLDSSFEDDHLRPSMKVVFDNNQWRAQTVEKMYSGDQVCAYRIIMTMQSGD